MTTTDFLPYIERMYNPRDPFYRVAYNVTHDHDDAEDIIADSIVKALRHLDSVTTDCEKWLYTIVTNTAIDWAKNVRRRMLRYSIDNAESHYPSPDVEVYRNDLQNDLWRVVADLPPHLRWVFVHKHYLQVDYLRLSREAGVSVPALKMRNHRAKTLLSERLHQYDPTTD